jgi:hypothetical protein
MARGSVTLTSGEDGAKRKQRRSQSRADLNHELHADVPEPKPAASTASHQEEVPGLPLPVGKPSTTARNSTGVKLSDIGKPLGDAMPASRVTGKTPSPDHRASSRTPAAAAPAPAPAAAAAAAATAGPGKVKAPLAAAGAAATDSSSDSESDELPAAPLQYGQEQIAKDLAMVQQRRAMALKVRTGPCASLCCSGLLRACAATHRWPDALAMWQELHCCWQGAHQRSAWVHASAP